MSYRRYYPKINLSAYTAGSIAGASSRLRSFYLFSEAKKFNINVSRPLHFKEAIHSDVIHIQKIYSYRALFWIVIYRALSKKVIFDIDDQINKRKEVLPVFLIVLFSSALTVDSEDRKKYWQNFFFFKKIEIIYDVADKKEVNLKPINFTKNNDKHIFFWIGNTNNFKSLDPFVSYLEEQKRYQLLAVIHKNNINYMSQKYPNVNFLPWHDGIAFSKKVSSRFMVLNHGCDKNSMMKSDNKMVLAILAGFVPIVSNTTSYAKLAKAIDAEYLVFNDLIDVIDISKRVSNNINLNAFFNKAFLYINKHYSRGAVLEKFYEHVI